MICGAHRDEARVVSHWHGPACPDFGCAIMMKLITT
jgi:hypothetical protein